MSTVGCRHSRVSSTTAGHEGGPLPCGRGLPGKSYLRESTLQESLSARDRPPRGITPSCLVWVGSMARDLWGLLGTKQGTNITLRLVSAIYPCAWCSGAREDVDVVEPLPQWTAAKLFISPGPHCIGKAAAGVFPSRFHTGHATTGLPARVRKNLGSSWATWPSPWYTELSGAGECSSSCAPLRSAPRSPPACPEPVPHFRDRRWD